MKISSQKKAIFEEWESGLLDFYKFGDNTALDRFKLKYPGDYIGLRKMNMKRIAIKDSIDPLFTMGESIYWFTLTFNDNKNNNSVEWKRKEAQRFLNNIAPMYLMVEEYGERNTKRYHIHGFCVRKYSLSESEFFEAFSKWHSRRKLYLCKDLKRGLKRIKYISKYIVKDIPKIRRSKSMSKLYLFYKSIKRLRKRFPSLFYKRLEYFYNSEITLNYLIDDDYFYKLNCPF